MAMTGGTLIYPTIKPFISAVITITSAARPRAAQPDAGLSLFMVAASTHDIRESAEPLERSMHPQTITAICPIAISTSGK